MSTLLLPDAAMVSRSQAIIGAYTATRVRIIAARPGNPLKAEVRTFDQALATRIPVFGEHLFNRAFGFCDDALDDAAAVADWYAEARVAGSFEIAPGSPHGQLLAMLQGFSDAYHAGWAATGPRVPMQPWLAAEGWRIYLGLCDGEPAGAAILYLAGGDAYLADSAVDPRFRRRGVHRALLDRRCADAKAAGAQLIFSGADYLSASQRNMLRKGLVLLHTKGIWTAPA